MNEEGFILNPDGFKFLLHPAGCWQSLACAQMPNLLPTHSPQRATCPLASESEGQRSGHGLRTSPKDLFRSLPRALGVCPQPALPALTFSNQEFAS